MNTLLEDLALLRDPKAERRALVSAIGRVVDARLYEHEDAIRALMSHPSPDVRAEATSTLLALWKRADLIDAAVHMGLHDSNEFVRGEVYIGLGNLMRSDRTVDPVLVRKALVAMTAVVTRDPDRAVQAGAYRTFLEILGRLKPGESVPARFDRDRNVEWGLFEPYLNEAATIDYTPASE